MNIQIRHISNTFNYGSSMMAITLIDKLSKDIENINIYIDAATKSDLERIRLESNNKKINFDGFQPPNNMLDKVIYKLKRMKLNKILDCIIIIGGDDISEYYGIEALEYELNLLKKLSENKIVILLGQTIGPFTGNRGDLARECLKKSIIYTRDDYCFEYLNDLGFKNIKRGRDLAFSNLPMQLKAKSIINRYGLESDEYIVLVTSGLSEYYTKNYNDYIKGQIQIVKNLLKEERLLNKKIVLLPHVLLPVKYDDRKIIKDILCELNNENRIVGILDELLPSEAREILGNGIFTITGRMHAAVSTFYMRKPAISLSYSVKYAGVIGDGLDMNDLVIESADEEIWKHCKVSELVNEKVEYILDNYENLINKINKNVNLTSKIVQDQLDDLIKKIKETNKI